MEHMHVLKLIHFSQMNEMMIEKYFQTLFNIFWKLLTSVSTQHDDIDMIFRLTPSIAVGRHLFSMQLRVDQSNASKFSCKQVPIQMW